jgi:hypothetical protein
VVTVTVHTTGTDRAAIDNHAIGRSLCLHTQPVQSVCHDLDAVAFLDAQFPGTSQHGAALRTGSGNENYREFIYCERYQRLRYLDSMQRCMAHAQVGNRFAAGIAFVGNPDISTHALQDLDHTGAGRVHAHVLQSQFRAWCNAGAHQKKCRRGYVCGNIDLDRVQRVPALQTDAGALTAQRVAHSGQHAFGVIAGGRRLGNAGSTLRIQPGQQQAGFDLCTRNRHVVMNTVQLRATADAQRRGALLRGSDARPHAAQRMHHAPHRPSRQ